MWEDKPEDVVEQCARELPVLEEVSERAIEPATYNMLIASEAKG